MSNDMFFCINPVDGEAGFDALMLVGDYDLKFYMLPNDDTDRPSTIVVRDDDTPLFRLCEMAFQMNYRQNGIVCPVCEKEGLDVCGHITFGEVVKNIFCVPSVI